MFNGDHGKMHSTDSVGDPTMYVHDALRQVTGTGTQPKTGAPGGAAAGAGAPRAPRLSPRAHGGVHPGQARSASSARGPASGTGGVRASRSPDVPGATCL